MKKNLLPLLAGLLFFGAAPFFAAAQTVEEHVETGRFGAGEPADGGAGSGAASHTNHRFFLGARLGPSLRFYTPSGDTAFTGGDTYGASLDTGIQGSVQIVPLFSIQTEAVFTWDKASKWQYALNSNQVDVDRYTQTFNAFFLEFPLMARLNFYPGKFRVSPFFGAYVILPLGEMKIRSDSPRGDGEESLPYSLSPPLGLLGGLSIGFPLRTGIIFADIRYTADLAEPELENSEITSYRRHMMTLSFGYEFGLLKKK